MSRTDQQMTFMDLYMDGSVGAEEVDDFVDLWHDQSYDMLGQAASLPDYLGMTADEYAAWVRDASALPEIVRARRERRPVDAVLPK